jgi:DnaJ-class molecular chaperone
VRYPDEEICDRCEGEGQITYNPSRIRDPQEEREARCPKCHGEGVVPHQEEEDFAA